MCFLGERHSITLGLRLDLGTGNGRLGRKAEGAGNGEGRDRMSAVGR